MFTTNLQILLVTFTMKVIIIALSLARRIVRIENLKNWKITYKRENTRKKNDYLFTKLFQSRKHESNYKNVITLVELTILIPFFQEI